ncbi:MAG: AraC family transcriptional regulator [Butyrivibrio sp.]|nr:AraC family transcriptional regulator [Butyrivibrio sp.]
MSKTFKISKIRRDPYFNMPSAHLHPMYEIYYLQNGARKIFLDDSIYLLDKGDMVFIPMNTIHKTSYVNDKAHERTTIIFNDEAVPDIKFSTSQVSFKKIFYSEPVIHIANIHRDYIEGLLNRMLSEYEQGDDYSDINIKNCLQELIIFLIRYKQHKNSEHIQNIDMADTLMQKAARYIRNNYMEELSLEAVAAHFNISPTYFSRKFKSSTGFGYKEYLINVRIQEASNMLLETNESINEIALKCGFNDSDYFGNAFKRTKGISPLKYRKSNRYI